ncbi:HNH endonuclease [Salinicola socius]|uniref:HNH endonuclease n=1 Tax=Salinicola socius TaxID=404433 RepID=UPI000B19F68C|nr:HNH endonuclease [Salinicola socius]
MSTQICAICGERDGVTRDHVPPKAIFPKPRPENLVTVPACLECNNGASDDDDLFKVFLSMQAASNSEIARRLFQEKTARTLERNQVLLSAIMEESREVQVVINQGWVETRTGVLWNSKAHDAVIERTMRGLYFHHSGSHVPKGSNLSVQWLRGIPEEIEVNLDSFNTVVIGDDQVTYKYMINEDDSRYSLWLFDFYGAHWASGHTSPS